MIWGPRRSTRTKTLFSYTTIFRSPPAILALADGTIFRGVSIGAPGHTVAEVVFNTAMTGYQEILTDPSYNGQIVTLTYPHIGHRSEEHTSELQSLMRNSYAVFCLKKKKIKSDENINCTRKQH